MASLLRASHTPRLVCPQISLFRSSSHWSSLLSSMPKDDSVRLEPLRRTFVNRRRKAANAISSTIYFQILGTGSNAGVPLSLFLYTDQQRYLFNCGEGTQRIAYELCPHRSLVNLTNVFFTARTWRNMGGLQGMCLTMRDSGAPEVTLHGPEGCLGLFQMTKEFVQLPNFEVVHHDGKKEFEDANFVVKHIPIEYNGPKVVSDAKCKYTTWLPHSNPGTDRSGNVVSGVIRSPDRDLNTIDQTVMAYLLDARPKPPELLINKCIELGVPVGPLLGELKANRSIVLDNGTTVEPHQVLGPPGPSLKTLVLECPSENYFDSLFDKLGPEQLPTDHLVYVFHFTPVQVADRREYKEWMATFKKSVKHVFLNERGNRVTSADAMVYYQRLHVIDKDLFPIPNMDNSTDNNRDKDEEGDKKSLETPPALCGSKYHLRPNIERDDSFALRHDPSTVDGMLNDEGLMTQLDEIKSRMAITEQDQSCDDYPKVTFLGTGSSVPNKYRNVSAILVEVEEDKFVLLDCGEGTLQQLHRSLGVSGSRRVLRQLKAVYISHIHADHHLGLVNVLQERHRSFRDEEPSKIFLLLPSNLIPFLSSYHLEVEPFLMDAHQMRNQHLIEFIPKNQTSKTQNMFPYVLEEMTKACGLKSVVTSRALHCPLAYCVQLTTKKGFKLVYSGDTRPNKDLVELGRDCDLLIHEATVEHFMLDHAKIKRHSTVFEAVESGVEMGAKFVMLTHFSQRYAKFTPTEDVDECRKKYENQCPQVGQAMDLMCISPKKLPGIPLVSAALPLLFKDDAEEMESKKEALINRKSSIVYNAKRQASEGQNNKSKKFNQGKGRLKIPKIDLLAGEK